MCSRRRFRGWRLGTRLFTMGLFEEGGNGRLDGLQG